ncbi:MAG TPA: barstar family protein [Intrasporangium sp.]|uniref:barstar family protein n=1 Tax=Intrasporangium sp. TaxID=1925024 RepID=UPI002B4915ED|nr:barstar family protein [Intrasporangium sp.]HKX67313.1 barstar family protein [Intrasporangium sp.]
MTTFLGRHDEVDDHIITLVAHGADVRVVRAGTGKRSVLAEFASALELPAWFGHNWDALVDALRELSNDDGRRIELVWDHAHELRESAPETYALVVDILEQVADERDDLGLTIIDR